MSKIHITDLEDMGMIALGLYAYENRYNAEYITADCQEAILQELTDVINTAKTLFIGTTPNWWTLIRAGWMIYWAIRKIRKKCKRLNASMTKP